MSVQLNYVIKYVRDMDRAIKFHTDVLQLKLRFSSPEWSEFETGTTTLALHRETAEHTAGTCQLGFRVGDIEDFYAENTSRGVEFTSPPTALHGQRIARFVGVDGEECSVSGP